MLKAGVLSVSGGVQGGPAVRGPAKLMRSTALRQTQTLLTVTQTVPVLCEHFASISIFVFFQFLT